MSVESRPVVLVVEDDALVLAAIRLTLGERGWVIESSSDGLRALEVLRGGGRIDAAVFDNELPGVQGLELIWYARRLPHREHLPIVMLSGSGLRRDAMLAGADEYLRKPEDVGLLAETLERFVAEGAGRRS